MKKSIQWRLALIALSVAVALFLFVPSTPLSAGLPDLWKQSVPKISLGLDLRGGSHLVMEVDTAKAVESSVDNIVADLQTSAASQKIAVVFSRSGQNIIAKVDDSIADKVEKLVKDSYAIIDVTARSRGELVYSMKPVEVRRLKEWAVTQALDRTRQLLRREIARHSDREPDETDPGWQALSLFEDEPA